MKNENVVVKNSVMLSLTQHLQRLSLPFLNNVRGRFQIKFGMTPLYNGGAFTLIELLVVVLIIGILAAVALPQYKLAVVKSRVATMLPMLKSISQANHAYYLANGELTVNVNNLDISLSSECTPTTATGNSAVGQLWKCGSDWVIDNSGGESVIANYCPGYNQTYDTCSPKREFRVFAQWRPTTGYKVDCHPLNDSSFGQKVCNSFALK